MARKQELQNTDIGELWRTYKPLEGRDDHADLILALIRKLILQGARDMAYGSWKDKLSDPLLLLELRIRNDAFLDQ
jgi:hypothetical protein